MPQPFTGSSKMPSYISYRVIPDTGFRILDGSGAYSRRISEYSSSRIQHAASIAQKQRSYVSASCIRYTDLGIVGIVC
jgi:hypothetical protein